MKVSVDNLIGSARRINSQRELDSDSNGTKKKDVKTDSISISNRIHNRLDGIESEFREIQSTLTKNQIIRDGITRLTDDLRQGGTNSKNILDEVTFEGKNVLRTFVGESITESLLNGRSEKIDEMIGSDIDRLRRLQVELDNIVASNLIGEDKIEGLMGNFNSIISELDNGSVDSISRLRADAVMRLTR